MLAHNAHRPSWQLGNSSWWVNDNRSMLQNITLRFWSGRHFGKEPSKDDWRGDLPLPKASDLASVPDRSGFIAKKNYFVPLPSCTHARGELSRVAWMFIYPPSYSTVLNPEIEGKHFVPRGRLGNKSFPAHMRESLGARTWLRFWFVKTSTREYNRIGSEV